MRKPIGFREMLPKETFPKWSTRPPSAPVAGNAEENHLVSKDCRSAAMPRDRPPPAPSSTGKSAGAAGRRRGTAPPSAPSPLLLLERRGLDRIRSRYRPSPDLVAAQDAARAQQSEDLKKEMAELFRQRAGVGRRVVAMVYAEYIDRQLDGTLAARIEEYRKAIKLRAHANSHDFIVLVKFHFNASRGMATKCAYAARFLLCQGVVPEAAQQKLREYGGIAACAEKFRILQQGATALRQPAHEAYPSSPRSKDGRKGAAFSSSASSAGQTQPKERAAECTSSAHAAVQPTEAVWDDDIFVTSGQADGDGSAEQHAERSRIVRARKMPNTSLRIYTAREAREVLWDGGHRNTSGIAEFVWDAAGNIHIKRARVLDAKRPK